MRLQKSMVRMCTKLFWEKIDALKNIRPCAQIIDTSVLSEEEVFESVKEIIF